MSSATSKAALSTPSATVKPSTPAPGTSAPETAAPSSAPASSAPATSTAPAGNGVLTTSIGGLPSGSVLTFGGKPEQFTVTLRNGTDTTYQNITPVISIQHCSCNDASGAAPAPAGTLAELDQSTGQWRSVIYDTQGTGMDYILGNIVQQPPFNLAPGASATFTFEIAFSPFADQLSIDSGSGKTGITANIVEVPSRTVVGTAASLPLTVTRAAS